MEKKNVYVRAQEVVRELPPLLQRIREHDKKLADQLKRAAQSVVLNIAEGRGNRDGNARLRFTTACGSAKEVRAALSVASDWGYIERRDGDPPRREARRRCAPSHGAWAESPNGPDNLQDIAQTSSSAMSTSLIRELGDVAVGHDELKPGSNLLGRPARTSESSFRSPWVVSVGFRDVSTTLFIARLICSKSDLSRFRTTGKHLLQPACCLKRPLLNDESHE